MLLRCTDTNGDTAWPERLAITRVDLGLIALQRGNVDEACSLGMEVVESSRLCADGLGRLGELDQVLVSGHGDVASVRELHERYLVERRTLGSGFLGPSAREGG